MEKQQKPKTPQLKPLPSHEEQGAPVPTGQPPDTRHCQQNLPFSPGKFFWPIQIQLCDLFGCLCHSVGVLNVDEPFHAFALLLDRVRRWLFESGSCRTPEGHPNISQQPIWTKTDSVCVTPSPRPRQGTGFRSSITSMGRRDRSVCDRSSSSTQPQRGQPGRRKEPQLNSQALNRAPPSLEGRLQGQFFMEPDV